MKKSLFALALMVAASFALAVPVTSTDAGGGYPVAQAVTSSPAASPASVNAMDAVQTPQAARMQASISIVDAAPLQTGSDASMTGQAVSQHAGCGQREPHPVMGKKKGGGKGGGGKKCIDIGSIASPTFHSST
jgi:hypothetical protein